MSGFLLDTNVISEFNRRGDPDQGVKQWLELADPTLLFVSVLSLGEIRFGVELLLPSRRRSQLEQWIDRDLPEWFDGRILAVDAAIVNRWGVLRAEAQRNGTPLPVIDALLAATAFEHNLSVVSRNVTDFRIAGLPVINPWEPQR